MLEHMKGLIEVFAARSRDRSTLDELHQMIGDQRSWHKAHDLFNRIRKKTLDAESRKDALADCQYLFEEACAKTLYNLSDTNAGFDEDSPYWIVPNALSLARRLGLHESEVTKIVAG
jgi:phage shock protein A